MKKLAFSTFLYLALVAGLTACDKKKTDGVGISNGNTSGPTSSPSGPGSETPTNSAFLNMKADLTGATGITTNVVVDKKDKRHLLKVSADGKIAVVLTGEHELLSFKLTPNYIVARVDISEKGGSCTLIAIPRINGITPVRCLNRKLINCSNNKGSNDGYDVVGDEVYFAYQQPTSQYYNGYCNGGSVEPSYAAISELRKWDGKSETVTTLFHSDVPTVADVQPVVRDVYTSTTGNVCIDTVNGGLMCREGNASKWSKPHAARFPAFFISPYLKQNDQLLSDYPFGPAKPKLNLSTFEVSDREGSLPDRIDFRSENGRILGTDGGNLYCVGPDGNSTKVLENLVKDARPARLAKYGWYYGPGSLRRVEIDTCELDKEDYVKETRLLSLTSLSWSLGDFLRIDGIGDTGLPSTSLIGADGRLVNNVTESIPVEHPIELSWK